MDVDLGGDFEGFLGRLRHHGYYFTVFTPASPTLLHTPFITHTLLHTPFTTHTHTPSPPYSVLTSHTSTPHFLLLHTLILHLLTSNSLPSLHLSHSPHAHHTITLITYSHIPDARERFMLHSTRNVFKTQTHCTHPIKQSSVLLLLCLVVPLL